MWRRRSGVSGEQGASLVEFALIAPVLFALLLGMITGGLALSAKNSMSNAVREGARLGATLPNGATWASDVRERVVALAGGDLKDDQICVRLVSIDAPATVGGDPVETTEQEWPSGTCPFAASEPKVPKSAQADTCLVKVWAQRSADLNVIFFSQDLDLESEAIGIHERRDTCS